MKYYIDKTVELNFRDAVQKVKAVLPGHGFGVVTEFDVDEKLRDKLGIDFRKYKVIGACNPKYAYEALQTEALIGTMLPCNIVVQQLESGKVQVAAIDPVASMQAIDNDNLNKAATFIKDELTKIIDEI